MTVTTNEAGTDAAVVDRYFAGLNEEAPAARAELIATTWTPDGRFRDPLLEADGHEALDAMIAVIHTTYPGYRFQRTTAIDAQHEHIRFAWEMVAPDGTIAMTGLDVGTLADDGRLSAIASFFGDLAGLAGLAEEVAE